MQIIRVVICQWVTSRFSIAPGIIYNDKSNARNLPHVHIYIYIYINIKTHGSEVRGHYCELFTCSDGFIIMALECATSLVNFVF